MMNISMITDASTSNQLAFKILDLDDVEKNYDGFRIKIENLTDWCDIPIKGTEMLESDIFTFDGLEPLAMYKVSGQAKYRGEWVDVAGASFKTHFIRELGNVPPVGESNKSGVMTNNEQIKMVTSSIIGGEQ